MIRTTITRRTLLAGLGAASLGPLALAQPGLLLKTVPSSGEKLPAVGLGSWITFNVGDDPTARDACADVMAAFFEGGGRMINSSPMYGSAQETIGYGLERLGRPQALFSADKVWTSSDGPDQIAESRRLWGIANFDLLQIHNLLSWEEHLPVLRAMKEQDRLRYIGITTSEGRRHDEFIAIMRSEPLDFIQVTYNIIDREIEIRHPAACRRARHGSDRQPALSTGRPDCRVRNSSLAAMGCRPRLHRLGAIPPQIHYLSPRRNLRHPGDKQCRACAREHGGCAWAIV